MTGRGARVDTKQALRQLGKALFEQPLSDLLSPSEGLRVEFERIPMPDRKGEDTLDEQDPVAEPRTLELPLLVRDGRLRRDPLAASVSPHSLYLGYPLAEARRAGPLAFAALAPLAPAMRTFSRLSGFERVVFVNHWLFVPGPTPEPDPEMLDSLLERLRGRFPDHALVFSGLTPDCGPLGHDLLLRELRHLGGRPLRRRTVYLFDPRRTAPGKKGRFVRKQIRRDLDLLERARNTAVADRDELMARADELRDLYEHLYLERHPTGLNARYGEGFLRALIASPLSRSIAWQAESGHLEAFCSTLIWRNTLLWSICGYRGRNARERGLFRRLYAHDVQIAQSTGCPLLLGAGNGDFKRFRGARPIQELDVVFDRHLSPRRRLPWTLMRTLRPAHPMSTEAHS